MADLPEYKRGEQLQPATTDVAFLKAAERQASAGNLLTNIGADIGLRAGIARSEQAGTELGKNPHGDLLPAMNKTDEAFQKAYRTTAQATLTLQGEELLSKGLTTINQANKLTSDLIENFSATMQKGMNEIASNAPQMDREAINQNLKLGLITAEGKLQAKLAQQNKEELKDNFAAYSQTTTNTIFDVTTSGDEAGGRQLFENYKQTVEAQIESGLLSKLDGQSLINTARTTYLTGREFAKAQDAKDKGELDKFLSDYGKKKPDDMSNTEWVQVGKDLLTLVNFQDTADAKNQALLVSEGNLRIADNSVTQDDVARYREEMSERNFNNFMTSYIIAQRKDKDNAEEIQFALDNWGNAGALANVDNKAIEKAFQVQYQDLQQKTGLDEFTAKTLTAAAASTPVTSFINELNAMALSGTPESREAARNAIKTVNQQKPGNLKGLSDDAENMLLMFDMARQGGQDINQANETATKAVLDIDKAELERRNTIWTTIEDKVTKGNGTWAKTAKNDLGLSSNVIVDDVALGVAYKAALKSSFISIGNLETAKAKANKYIMATHDVTRANGSAQFVFKPIERVLGITYKQLPFVYSQVSEQVNAQVEAFNKLYESGQSDFKYELVESSKISFEEYTAAQDELKKALEGTSEFKELILGAAEARLGRIHKPIYDITALKAKIASYEQPGLPQIKRVYRHGEPEVFALNIYANDLTAVNGMQVYDVMLQGTDSDSPEEFIGANNMLGRSVFYIPNETKFHEDYIKYIETSSSGDAKAVKEMQEQMKEHQRKAKERIEREKGPASDRKGTEIIVDNAGNIGVENNGDNSNG